MADPTTFKVLLIGNSGVGKTAFLNRYLKKEFEHLIEPTTGVEKHHLDLNTTAGPVCFEIWDVSGSQKISTLYSDEYDANAAIIMFDLTNRVSYNNVPNWYQSIVKDRGGFAQPIPICICGNKVDAPPERKLPQTTITFPRKKATGYVEISAMTTVNIYEPFLILARQLLMDRTVGFSPLPYIGEGVFIAPPEGETALVSDEFLNSKVPAREIFSRGASSGPSLAGSRPSTPSVGSPKRPDDAFNGRLKFLSAKAVEPKSTPQAVERETKSQLEKRELKEQLLELRPAISDPVKEETQPLSIPERKDLPESTESLFVLCIHCIRMIVVTSIQGTKLARHGCRFSLTTTACRSCRQLSGDVTEVRMSPDLIRYSAMYECARKVAGDEVVVLTKEKSVACLSLEELTEGIGLDCRIQGVLTSSDTLLRVNELERKDVLLGYLPGAFL